MVELVASETELTTAATDLVLAGLCAVLARGLLRPGPGGGYRARLWGGVFALLGGASLLGAVAHGLALDAGVRDLLWHPLYLALGLAIGLFAVGAVLDRWGEPVARRLLPAALVAGGLFYAVAQWQGGAFWVFLGYQALALLFALGSYLGLGRHGRLPGAWLLVTGIALTLLAALVQASGLELTLGWRLDHNGLFHLLLVPGLGCLAAGVRRGPAPPRGGRS
ncbi:MAG TPA: hypothetical protein VIX81_05630 [Gammaproteobacteria bacterium]